MNTRQKNLKGYLIKKYCIIIKYDSRKSERFKYLKEKLKKYFGEIYYVEGDYNYGRLKKLLKNGEVKFLFTQLHWRRLAYR